MLRDGGNIENVLFTNLQIHTRQFSDEWWGEGEPICVTAIDRRSDNKAGHIRNVHFENINCIGENGIFLHGSKDNYLEDMSRADNHSLHGIAVPPYHAHRGPHGHR